jgi:ABC-2 type transport system ATP-binding protein
MMRSLPGTQALGWSPEGGSQVTVVAASGLSKRYGAVTAVDGVDLRVDAGEIYALLGLNGAGKTTTIRMLLGMIRPTTGSVALLGTPVGPARRSVWARVGYLVEGPAAYPELTVRENLDVVRRLRRLADRRTVDEVIERLRLGPYADRRARTLSLGNAQRLGLAKALIHRPELLILDEPANGLDPAGVVEIRHLLRELAEGHGATVFLSSHILAEVARLATRIGIIHEGRLLQEIDTDDLARLVRQRLVVSARDGAGARAALAAAGFTAEPAGDGSLVVRDERAVHQPDEVATLLVSAGCPPTRLAVEREDLETYFLRLVGAAPHPEENSDA